MWGWPQAVLLLGQPSGLGPPLTRRLALTLAAPSPTALFYDYYNPQGQCEGTTSPVGRPA